MVRLAVALWLRSDVVTVLSALDGPSPRVPRFDDLAVIPLEDADARRT